MKHCNEPLSSTKGGEILDQLSQCEINKMDSAPCS